MPGEFEVIRRYFEPAAESGRGVQLGLGDDCALLEPPEGETLAVSIDTLVEGVHFLPSIDPEDLAWRLLGASVSDLAAMGAQPLWLTLAITLPEADESWLEAFSRGLLAATRACQVRLVGGDTTSGPCRILTAQVHGSVPVDQALRRSGANPGDLIFVSGTLGDSRAGLALLTDLPDSAGSLSEQAYLLQRFLRPEPRFELGLALRGIATAAIDISDGLLADLSHLLNRSSVGARVRVEDLPLSTALLELDSQQLAREWALSGGEDFELCFTVSPQNSAKISKLAERLNLSLTQIGEVTRGQGVQLTSGNEVWHSKTPAGFDHFGGDR